MHHNTAHRSHSFHFSRPAQTTGLPSRHLAYWSQITQGYRVARAPTYSCILETLPPTPIRSHRPHTGAMTGSMPNPPPKHGYTPITSVHFSLKSQSKTHFQPNAQERKVVCAQKTQSCTLEPDRSILPLHFADRDHHREPIASAYKKKSAPRNAANAPMSSPSPATRSKMSPNSGA